MHSEFKEQALKAVYGNGFRAGYAAAVETVKAVAETASEGKQEMTLLLQLLTEDLPRTFEDHCSWEAPAVAHLALCDENTQYLQ